MTDVSVSHYFAVFLWESKCGLDGKPHRGQTAGWRPCWCWAVRWSVKTNKAENQKITFWLSLKKKKTLFSFNFKLSAMAYFFYFFPLPPGWWWWWRWWCCVCGYVSAFLDVLVAPDGRVARQRHQTLGSVTDEREAYQRRTRTGAVQLPPDAFYLWQRNKRPEISFVRREGQRGNHW